MHYGEEGDKGFVLWTVDANGASLEFVPTPARRMVHLDFDDKPDMEAVKAAAVSAQGAFVRVRWSVAEEEQATVDRAAVLAALDGATEVKLEGRVIPVVRSRAEGISQAHSLAEKVRRWAEATGVEVTACRLSTWGQRISTGSCRKFARWRTLHERTQSPSAG